MADQEAIIIFAPPPDSKSAEAEIAHILSGLFVRHYSVHWLIDQTCDIHQYRGGNDASAIGPDGVHFTDVSVLADPDHPLQTAKRLFILGDSNHSVDCLHYLDDSPCLVVLAAVSLLKTFRQKMREDATWPLAYTKWLKSLDTAATHALATTLENHKRYAETSDSMMSGLSLLPETAVIATFTSDQIALLDYGANGTPALIYSDMTLPAVRCAETKAPQSAQGSWTVWARGDSKSVRTIEQSAKALLSFGVHMNVIWLPVGSLPPSVTEIPTPDIIIDFTDATTYAFGLLANHARRNGIPLICHCAGWAADISAAAAIKLRSAEDVHALTAALSVLTTQPDVYRYFAKPSLVEEETEKATDRWLNCLHNLSAPVTPLISPPIQPDVLSLDSLPSAALSPDTIDGKAILVGTLPGRSILMAVWPNIDWSSCAIFLPAAAAWHLSRKLRFPAPLLPQRLGFESCLLQDINDLSPFLPFLQGHGNCVYMLPKGDEDDIAHPKTESTTAPCFKTTFGFQSDALADFDRLMGFDASIGAAWHLNFLAHQLDTVFLMAGLSHITIKTGLESHSIVVKNGSHSQLLEIGQPIIVPKGPHDLLSFGLSATDRITGKPLSPRELLQLFTTSPLELAWYRE
ncbi:hypothetical protein GCM10017044_11210 [Kordiimonas sediminis]|uniref:Uncharacterized protein n=1 Tax=Kordiimonas sediminis TaxID=1735581 RepID=A0A919ANW5_9PROT|nr:hypothetical protein [Kordiimonas sediminis]GHF18444.1 hypothetical protein GCM10017044_11210 [Kordiimonas sediminis]